MKTMMSKKQLKEVVKLLNNEAAFLSNHWDDYEYAIEYLQLALIVCNDLELSRPRSTFSCVTMNKIEGFLSQISDPKYKKERRRSIESDKNGFYSYTRTLLTIPTDGKQDITSIPYPAIESILSFNIGLCYSLQGSQGWQEAANEATLYFSRAATLLNNNDINNDSEIDTSDENGIPFRLDSIAILYNQALLHSRAERYDDALICYLEAVRKSLAKYGDEDISATKALNKILGVILHFLNQVSDYENVCKDTCHFLAKSISLQFSVISQGEICFDKNTGAVFSNQIASLNKNVCELKLSESSFIDNSAPFNLEKTLTSKSADYDLGCTSFKEVPRKIRRVSSHRSIRSGLSC